MLILWDRKWRFFTGNHVKIVIFPWFLHKNHKAGTSESASLMKKTLSGPMWPECTIRTLRSQRSKFLVWKGDFSQDWPIWSGRVILVNSRSHGQNYHGQDHSKPRPGPRETPDMCHVILPSCARLWSRVYAWVPLPYTCTVHVVHGQTAAGPVVKLSVRLEWP